MLSRNQPLKAPLFFVHQYREFALKVFELPKSIKKRCYSDREWSGVKGLWFFRVCCQLRDQIFNIVNFPANLIHKFRDFRPNFPKLLSSIFVHYERVQEQKNLQQLVVHVVKTRFQLQVFLKIVFDEVMTALVGRGLEQKRTFFGNFINGTVQPNKSLDTLFLSVNPFLLLFSSALREYRLELLDSNPVGTANGDGRTYDAAERSEPIQKSDAVPIHKNHPFPVSKAGKGQNKKPKRQGPSQQLNEHLHALAHSTARLQMGVCA